MPLPSTDITGAMGSCFKIDTNPSAVLLGVRELSMTTVDLAGRLNLAQPIVGQAVIRGQKIAEDQGLSFIEKYSQ